MDDLPSAWPTRYKLLAIFLFVGSLAIIGFAANRFANALPNELLFPLVVGMFAFGLGLIVGEKSAARHFQKQRDRDGSSTDIE